MSGSEGGADVLALDANANEAGSACVPPCLYHLFAACPPLSPCLRGEVDNPGGSATVGYCYAGGSREVDLFDFNAAGAANVTITGTTRAGAICFTGTLTLGPDGSGPGVYMEPSGRVVATTILDGRTGLLTVTCDGATFTVNYGSNACIVEGYGPACAMGACP